MADQITDSQLAEIKLGFTLFDNDDDGEITVKELGKVMGLVNQQITENELQDMLNEVDADGSGGISFTEFLSIMIRKLKESDLMVDLTEVFKIFDVSDDDFIDAPELKYVLNELLGESCTEEQIEEMIREADKDGDGRVGYSDFIQMVSEGFN
mmetsp:Transcript_39690/g.45188  ORF Transcript_39690/g.45188 Transcript_39690/m.45188 type:complete len:153 (-) Transcript_39690:467-925(-)|eukprot:CAMPEP_0115009982 /NCGR_PEP_ID=MMETSP0216-20121206/22994_1 /TAXON_ID=223996 /ORGANISM="Protocruzia adherens, Strain Boccale" /LENGTH=152 /DNA_ID=CAMNT_0002378009 /DNA_START=829 /DNA_END=1287 /DNA_ORIENTATION=+